MIKMLELSIGIYKLEGGSKIGFTLFKNIL